MSIPCSHWRDCGIIGGGCCAAGILFRPSYGACLNHCDHYDGPPRAGIAEMLVHGKLIPSSHRIRRAQVLAGPGNSQPMYRRRTQSTGRFRRVRSMPIGRVMQGSQRQAVCSKCSRMKKVRQAQAPGTYGIIPARPGDERKYLGDLMGSTIARLTGRQPCAGCKKVEAGLNLVDKWGRKLVAHAH